MMADFVKDSDELCDVYFKTNSTDGNTNYWHALQAGHVAELLELYGNLYRYAQQGWENVNGTLSKGYHRHSQRGGGPGSSSKILPLFQSMTRGTMWRHGHLQQFFKSIGFDLSKIVIEYGKVARQPKNEDATLEAVKSFADMIFVLGSCQDVFGPDLQDDGSVGDSDEEDMTTDEANAFMD